MLKPLRVLLVEDSEDDALLLDRSLRRGGYDPDVTRVETAPEMTAALERSKFQVVISDYYLPEFDAPRALQLLKDRQFDVPLIVISGTVQEAIVVEAMRAGARDYLMKDNLTRLPAVIERELVEVEARRERVHFESQLQQTQKLESIGLLAGGVAHDFNNLLTGILGNSSLALDSMPRSSPARQMLEDVVQASQRAAGLTRQLLAYAGKGRFVVEPVDISDLVQEISSLIQTSISRNVQLRLDLQRKLPCVMADSTQIQQLIMNLVINGAEAIGEEKNGTVLVTTSVQEVDDIYISRNFPADGIQPGKYVALEVHDSGSGMDEATQAKIFDPFFTTKFTGRGLGLSATQGIVRGHKGAIRVYSTPGQGSTFKVLFPATPDEPARAPSADRARNLTGDGLILVVDDEDVVRRIAKTALERYGYTVIVAENGREAVTLFQERSGEISLVLLDMTMPVMGGEQALRHLREIAPGCRVILSSGYNEVEAIRRFTGKNLGGFIQKPYTAAQLAEKVRAVLRPGA
ncbi:MAG: response regulator [Acidobacteriota bacterium]|nr:response regulator [Acidobacteriota bacterium]